jgi:N-acyl-D-amino-acid deacylase
VRRVLFLFLLLALPAWVLGQAPIRNGNPRPAAILIHGGTVVDGTGARRRRADVRIVGERIEAVGRLEPRPGERMIEAAGMVVAPGFIDTHSHANGGIMESPEAETQVRQGITTAVVGQDGGSSLPLAKFFADMEAHPAALNFASFVGHATVRRQVMGDDYKRTATPVEITKMRALVEREMQSGALGLSSGLEYEVGSYSNTEEIIALAQSAAKYGGIYISHVRDEGNGALTSFRELIRIAEEGKLPAQISHIKLAAAGVWGKADEVVEMMQKAKRRHLDITADLYPYTYWSSTITVLTLSRDWENPAVWRKALDDVGGADHVLLSGYSPDPTWAGKTIAQIAAMTLKDPVTVIQEVVRKTHGAEPRGSERVIVTAMTEADLRRFMRAPQVMFCTDGGLRSAHPRGAGSYPRVLGRYVREQHVLKLEEAIRKMTSLPARRMSFADRGKLQPGMKADVVIFDPKTVIDTATTADPTAKPVGIRDVLVNGVSVLDGGRITGALPGQVLRHAAGSSLPHK